MTGLCEDHAAQWNAWSDYRLVVPFRINSATSYDDSLRGLRDRRKRLVDDWRDTIRFQQNLIRRICANRCQQSGSAEEAA